MKLAVVVAVGLVAARVAAAAPPASSCQLGVRYAKQRDLPRAALHLEACDATGLGEAAAAEVERARRDVRARIEASELAKLAVVTTPAGLVVEIDALPGERLITPATVWVRAGHHLVRVAHDAAGLVDHPVIGAIDIKARSYGTIVLDAGKPPARAPRDGVADFNEDPPDIDVAPPPDLEHKSLLPDKYGPRGPAGPALVDPFSIVVARPAALPAWRLGARVGGGSFGHAGGGRVDLSIAALVRARAPWSVTWPRPFELELRVDWSRRGTATDALGTAAVALAIDKILFAPDAAWISVGAALRGELRGAAMLDGVAVNRAGLAAAGTVELALRSLPVAIGVRYEHGVTELLAGAREHAIVLELGADWRR